jgi:excisionase family DNA binding protein
LVSTADEIAEAYRRAEQRLRLVLLGDGVSEPGLVKGEEARLRVTTALRRMRDAFADALDDDDAGSPRENRALLTPTEVARELGVRVDAVYRAVKRNEIAVLRAGTNPRGALRIPASEVARLRESRG